jgi:2-dehydro-3-deoxygalactonokinase
MRPLIALDWGTSSLRGARLGIDGEVLEERSFARGILSVNVGGFQAVFTQHFGDWMGAADALCVISGMAGSRQGWVEAPYCACPAGPLEVAARLAWIERDRIAVVPGISFESGGVPDVMRGEETQVFGALQLLSLDSGTFVLPGTHSKWVQVQASRIQSFATLMTGEVYALLRHHSILARTLPEDDAPLHGHAFDLGVAHALRGPGLLQCAFSARTLALFGRLPQEQGTSYLSGLVIGEELRSRSPVGAHTVTVIGEPALTQRYERALSQCGVRTQVVAANPAWRGLFEIAATLQS